MFIFSSLAVAAARILLCLYLTFILYLSRFALTLSFSVARKLKIYIYMRADFIMSEVYAKQPIFWIYDRLLLVFGVSVCV